MKLIEIFEPEWKNVELSSDGVTKNTNLNRVKGYKDSKNSLLGAGHFSNVFNHKDEHMVKKISNHPKSAIQDQYWTYVNRLITTKIWQENPFFPRIYSITEYELNGEILYKGVLEKLINVNEIEPEIFDPYVLSLSNNKDVQLYTKDRDYFGIKNKQILAHLAYTIKRVIQKQIAADIILNDKLLEAIKWFQANNDIGKIDIHADNLMFRRGKTGIQLVINDPVSFKETI